MNKSKAARAALLTAKDVVPASRNVVGSLRPAVKWRGKIYKGPIDGEEGHFGAARMVPDNALGPYDHEDVYNIADRGWIDHKGRFLDRSRAYEYAKEWDMIKPEYRQYTDRAKN